MNRRRLALLAAISLVAVLYSASAAFSQSAVMDGQRVFWLQDDMMISLRYARNLANGAGLVWNPGEPPVEGYSNLAWVGWMAGLHWIGLPVNLTSLGVLVTNILLAAILLWQTARLFEALGGRSAGLLLGALLALAATYDLPRWTLTGMETVLLSVIFLEAVMRTLKEAEAGRPRALTFFGAGLMGIVRADGLIYAGLVVLLAVAVNPNRRRILALSGLALLLPLAQVIFRLGYYGYPLPNTYYLKVTGWGLVQRLGPGIRYLGHFLAAYAPLLLSGAAVLWRRGQPRARLVWLLVLPLCAYALFVGGDDFAGGRFFLPWLPIAAAVAFIAPERLLPSRWARWQASGGLILAGLAIFFNPFNVLAGPGNEIHFVRAGLFLEKNTPPQTAIAHFWAGAAPYFANRPAVDLLGKNDAQVGHGAAQPGSFKPGHNKYDFVYSLGVLQPDLALQALHPGRIETLADVERYAQGADAYLGKLYLDAAFQQHYAANAALIGGIAVFIRADSPALPALMTGRCADVENPARLALGMRRMCWAEESR